MNKKELAAENSRPWKSREIALHVIKALFEDDEAYHQWYDAVYDQWRWKDEARYEQEIFGKLTQLEKEKGKKFDDVLAEIRASKDETKELLFLRRIHGTRFDLLPDELDILRRIHEKWRHPAKSDRGKYRRVEQSDGR